MQLLWPTALCELIAVETNRYAFQRHVRDWTPTNADEIWAFLATIVWDTTHCPHLKSIGAVRNLVECQHSRSA